MGEADTSIVKPPWFPGANKPRKHLSGGVIGLLVGVGILLALLFVYGVGRLIFIRTYNMPSGSMEDTLPPKHLFAGDELPYLYGNPQRGDIAVFKLPDGKAVSYVKRVVGLPGDTVEIKDGVLLVNGERSPANDHFKEPPDGDFALQTVPEGQYFVMGDNTNHSSDSRYWGYVPRENFLTRVMGYK